MGVGELFKEAAKRCLMQFWANESSVTDDIKPKKKKVKAL